MTDEAMDGPAPAETAGKKRGLFFWGKIAGIIRVGVAAGGAAWYFFLGGKQHFAPAVKAEPEPAMPIFVEIKPFVVSVAAAEGTAHYVQLGINFKMVNSAAGEVVTAVLPVVQDAIRQTVLGYKLEDIQTPAGVDKLRADLVKQVNEVLGHALGTERVKRLAGAEGDGTLVHNMYFTTLVIE
jgi:flagellar protein FliL